MSSNIVLPSLTNWTEQHVTAIYNATTLAQFNEAFDAFLAEDAQITVNGRHLTRKQYHQLLWGEKLAERTQDPASIKYGGAVEVPANSKEPVSAGSVGLYYSGQIYGRFLVFGGPTASTVTATLNVVIVQAIPPPKEPHGVHGDFDGRRVSVLSEVVTDHADPIVQPGGPIRPVPVTASA